MKRHRLKVLRAGRNSGTSPIRGLQLLTQGGPSSVTDTLVRVMYMQGFRQGKVGVGAAAAVIFFLLVLVISIVQRRLVKEERAFQ
jgi:multiple sugar transport system permease protein